MFTNTNIAHLLPILYILLIAHTILTVGLPIPRQEHMPESDLIAGEEFLSMLTRAQSHADLHRQPIVDDEKFGLTKTRTSRSQILDHANELKHVGVVDPSVKVTKSSDTDLDSTSRIQIRNDIDDAQEIKVDDSTSTEDGTIIAVRVSSSIGHSMINKHVYTNAEQKEAVEESTDTETEITTITDTTESIPDGLGNELIQEQIEHVAQVTDQEAVASQDTPSIIAEANKSEFHVDEIEPVSRDYNDNPVPSLKANPSGSIPFDGKTYPGTVIYHNNGGNNAAPSVSYSTVIQALPSAPKTWTSNAAQKTPTMRKPPPNTQNTTGVTPMPHPRSSDINNQHSSSAAETKDYYVTSNYEANQRYYSSEPTERNWGIPEQNYHEPSKPYTPIVYGQPEQNYEVDESVSLETNGRAHGIQPIPQSVPTATNQDGRPSHPVANSKVISGKKDDNQKVGYVVEGRNYRKYRVEERTSDGFIVGEYGVVRHDDGSLRGVRYTADGTISPRLIYDALMKFLSL